MITEFLDLLSIPNVATDATNIRRNADRIVEILQKRGVETRLLETPGAPPVVYGEIRTPGVTRTLVFYAHYDGQPVDSRDWIGGQPFRPILRSNGKDLALPTPGVRFDPEWRIFARSASDDKAPIIALAAALDALKANRIPLTSNIKFFFEGEEEAGSPHLLDTVKANQSLLSGDVWLICDGPVHQTRRPQIYFGARGITGIELMVYGAKRELHSGHYGGWAPNPAMMLARLLASMKDESGHVLIKGFYDGVTPLSEAERQAVAEAPVNDAELRGELGLARTEGDGRALKELINQPSLNIRGLASSAVGAEARNVVPSTASASLDIRLVKGLDHRRAIDLLIAHIRSQGYHIVEAEPDEPTRLKHAKIAKVSRKGGYNPVRTSMDLPIAKAVVAAIEKVHGPAVKIPTLGGSVPLYAFEEVLNAVMVGMPIANHDNNQHSSNENIRLQNLWDGVETMAALLTMN
jgi:acetylornithine deacetylase/succinyl-diaminopimelate desuccinylase-like protein